METSLKYSEFLQQVAARVAFEAHGPYICNIIKYTADFKAHPEYCKKLQKTTKAKLVEIESIMTTFGKQGTFLFLARTFKKNQNMTEMEARITWLLRLSAYHAKRGN